MIHFREIDGSDFLFLIPFAVIIVLWTLVSKFGIINPVLISNPFQVAETIWNLLIKQTADGHSVLLTHIGQSYFRLFISFIIAALIGVGFGILLGAREKWYLFFNPVLTILMPIPGIAWAPIFMLWIGFGDPTIITVAALAAFFPIVYNTAAGVRHMEKELIWAARSMGAKNSTLFLRVYIPHAAAYIFTGLRLGLARGWRTVIAVEMIAASLWGLGFMIFDAREYLLPSVIYAGIIILAVSYYLLDSVLIRWIESRTIDRWGMRETGGL